MSEETFSDTLIRLEAFKRIFVFRLKIDFFARGKSLVFGQKWPNFEVDIFHLFMSLEILACLKTLLGIVLKCKKKKKRFLERIFPGPLEA